VTRARAQGIARVLVDTGGLIAGDLGRTLKQAKIDLLDPDLVICLARGGECEAVLRPYRVGARPRIVRLAPSPAARSRNAEMRRRYRDEALDWMRKAVAGDANSAKARFGSVCERLFGTTNTQFIHNLRGNTQITRNVRQVTRSVNPKELAAWTLCDLHERTSDYLYQVYDTIDHPALGQSPRDAFHAGLESGGFRLQRMIPYDQEFLIATLPATPKGTAIVASGRGVKIHHIYYWSDRFREPGIENEPVPVRYDPFDAGAAYAFGTPHTASTEIARSRLSIPSVETSIV